MAAFLLLSTTELYAHEQPDVQGHRLEDSGYVKKWYSNEIEQPDGHAIWYPDVLADGGSVSVYHRN